MVCIASEDTDSGVDCSYYHVATVKTNWPWLNREIETRLHQGMPVLTAKHLAKPRGFKQQDWIAKSHFVVDDVGEYRGVVQLNLEQWDYFNGAAHGNPYGKHVLFDAQTQKPITLKDWLKPGSEAALLSVLQQRNRAWLEENSSEENYANMTLSDDVTVSAKGVAFHYAVYELGAYVLGAPTLSVSWQDMQPFMRPEWYARLSR